MIDEEFEYLEQDEPDYPPQEPEKRMAGDYEIIQSFLIGDKEIVMGENQNAAKGERYMCAFCDRNEIFALHTEVMVSDDFCEIAKLYADRLGEQAEKTRIDLLTPKIQGIQNEPLTQEQCTAISYADDLKNRIVVIKPEVLRREYRRATNQIKLCIGGFGASPNSRGSACFCVDLYSGKTSRYERMDVMGTLTERQKKLLCHWSFTPPVRWTSSDTQAPYLWTSALPCSIFVIWAHNSSLLDCW